jgi:hypothetical protein
LYSNFYRHTWIRSEAPIIDKSTVAQISDTPETVCADLPGDLQTDDGGEITTLLVVCPLSWNV